MSTAARWTESEQAERVAAHAACRAKTPRDTKGRCDYCFDNLDYCGAVAAVEGAIDVRREREHG